MPELIIPNPHPMFPPLPVAALVASRRRRRSLGWPLGLLQLSTVQPVVTAVNGKDELNLYCCNISPVAQDFDDPLKWCMQKVNFYHIFFRTVDMLQKESAGTLKYMVCVARDMLAIPGVSISIECLFSSLKHTLSDAWSSMTTETVSVDIVTKEWLKSRLAEGIDYTEFIRINN
jgi:hypothetical protein